MCAWSSYESKTNTVVFDELLVWVYLSREISIHGLRFFLCMLRNSHHWLRASLAGTKSKTRITNELLLTLTHWNPNRRSTVSDRRKTARIEAWTGTHVKYVLELVIYGIEQASEPSESGDILFSWLLSNEYLQSNR